MRMRYSPCTTIRAARAGYKGFGNFGQHHPGLPFIRTSVDHGTALDLAGKNLADPGSLTTAINHAIQMVEKKI